MRIFWFIFFLIPVWFSVTDLNCGVPWLPGETICWNTNTYINRRNEKAEVEPFIVQVNNHFFRVMNKSSNLQCFIDNELSVNIANAYISKSGSGLMLSTDIKVSILHVLKSSSLSSCFQQTKLKWLTDNKLISVTSFCFPLFALMTETSRLDRVLISITKGNNKV